MAIQMVSIRPLTGKPLTIIFHVRWTGCRIVNRSVMSVLFAFMGSMASATSASLAAGW